MRKLLVAVAALTMAVSAMAGTGWLDSYVYMNDGVGDTWYDLQGAGQPGGKFNGADLGIFQQNGQLWLNSEINAWANLGDTYNYMSLYWRLGTSGGYTEQQDATLDNPGGGNNWRGITPSVNLLTGLTPGTYTIQVYAERSHSWGGGGPYITRVDVDGDTGGGAVDNPFAATFDVIPEPTTLALVGLGIAGLLVYRRRR